MSYGVEDFEMYFSWDGEDQEILCPHPKCEWYFGIYDKILGELVTAAAEHLEEKHSD